jgi:hypothetical protein
MTMEPGCVRPQGHQMTVAPLVYNSDSSIQAPVFGCPSVCSDKATMASGGAGGLQRVRSQLRRIELEGFEVNN